MLITKYKKLIVAIMVSTSLSFPIFALSLQSSLELALKKSDTIKILEINKQQSLLTVDLSNVTRLVSYSVSPYITSNVDNSFYKYSLSSVGTGLVNINIPGSYEATKEGDATDDSNISLSLNTNVINDGSSKLFYDTTPQLTVDHTFLYGEYGTTLKDLNEQVNLLTIDQNYKNGIISFKKNLLNLFKGFNENAKNIELTENSLKINKKTVANKLALEYYNKTSVGYKSDIVTITSLENTLTNLNTQKQSMLTQYKNYTAQDYEGIDTVEAPILTIPKNTKDSLSVLIAQLNLQIAQNDVDEVNKSKERSSMKLSGTLASTQTSYDITSVNPDTYTSSYSSNYKGSVGATYTTNNLSLIGNVELTSTYYSSNWDNSVQIGIGGRWTNDTTKSTDIIESKKSSNNLISKQNSLTNALLDTSYNKMNTQSELDSWNYKYSQIKDNLKIAQDNIELTQQMFDLGLKSQQEIDDSVFKLSQLKYDELDVLIDGWITELSIESLEL
ncbi:MAG: hypothetical protein JJE21_00975 [Spirochaetaceae bacterium]|nr:hypothetical protein [Spirochaetaceae bacterium]